MHLSEHLTFELRTKEEKDPPIWDNNSFFQAVRTQIAPPSGKLGELRITKEASVGGTKSEDL